MDDSTSSVASAFCSQLRRYCAYLESSCSSLRSAVDRRSSSLPPSSSSSFFTSLHDRVISTSKEVESLEAMTTGTISFEELLGHCMELYKQNETSLAMVEDRLEQYGHKPEYIASGLFLDQATEEILATSQNSWSFASFAGGNEKLQIETFYSGLDLGSGNDKEQDSSLYSDSLSLQDLGLSAAGLACLAQEGMGFDHQSLNDMNKHTKPAVKCHFQTLRARVSQELTILTESSPGVECVPVSTSFNPAILKEMCRADNPKSAPVISVNEVTEEEYNNSPIWLKMQMSLEDLNTFLKRICDMLSSKADNGVHDGGFVDQEDLMSLDAGAKMKPCLLLLVRLGRLITGHENGATVYRLVYT